MAFRFSLFLTQWEMCLIFLMSDKSLCFINIGRKIFCLTGTLTFLVLNIVSNLLPNKYIICYLFIIMLGIWWKEITIWDNIFMTTDIYSYLIYICGKINLYKISKDLAIFQNYQPLYAGQVIFRTLVPFRIFFCLIIINNSKK